MDFSQGDENLEYSFLVPFLWYRAKDKDLVEFEIYESRMKQQHLFLCGKLKEK